MGGRVSDVERFCVFCGEEILHVGRFRHFCKFSDDCLFDNKVDFDVKDSCEDD
jgi:hypothetical protein